MNRWRCCEFWSGRHQHTNKSSSLRLQSSYNSRLRVQTIDRRSRGVVLTRVSPSQNKTKDRGKRKTKASLPHATLRNSSAHHSFVSPNQITQEKKKPFKEKKIIYNCNSRKKKKKLCKSFLWKPEVNHSLSDLERKKNEMMWFSFRNDSQPLTEKTRGRSSCTWGTASVKLQIFSEQSVQIIWTAALNRGSMFSYFLKYLNQLHPVFLRTLHRCFW